MLYLEGVDDARRFMSALRAAARVKPVVVMKAGRHASRPTTVAPSTRASLVGGDDVFDAAMRRAGVLRIRDFSQLYTAAATLGAGVRVRGRRLAIVTNAGGPGQIAADRAADRGLHAGRARRGVARRGCAPCCRRVTRTAIRSTCAATWTARSSRAAARICLEDPDVDALLAILTPHALTDADAIAAVAGRDRARAVASRSSPAGWAARRWRRAAQRFAEHRVPSYARPETAVDAIAALALYTANQEQLLQVPEPLGADLGAGPRHARRP